MHVVKDMAYSCRKDGSPYSLCQSCVDKHPPDFKGTILDDIKDISILDRAKLAAQGAVDIMNVANGINELGKNIEKIGEKAGQFFDQLFS